MNKKLIFLFFLTMTSLRAKQHEKYVYHNLPAHFHMDDDAHIQMILICASVSAKYVAYTFKEVRSHNGVKFLAYNRDSYFTLLLNRKSNECEIEFNACNDTFSYSSFKSMMDAFFLSDQC